jgi:hypothetical protein
LQIQYRSYEERKTNTKIVLKPASQFQFKIFIEPPPFSLITIALPLAHRSSFLRKKDKQNAKERQTLVKTDLLGTAQTKMWLMDVTHYSIPIAT